MAGADQRRRFSNLCKYYQQRCSGRRLLAGVISQRGLPLSLVSTLECWEVSPIIALSPALLLQILLDLFRFDIYILLL